MFSHMDQKKVSLTCVFRVCGDKDKVKERLASLIDPSYDLVVVGNNYEAFHHKKKKKMIVLLM